MPLWVLWWNALQMLRPAFSRLQTFLWFATTVAGFTVRTEHLAVTSIVRALKLMPGCYGNLVKHMHSSAVRLNDLNALWTRIVLLFSSPIRVNGRRVLVGDGIKAPKRGKKMPGGVISQGLLQYLAAVATTQVWNSFGSWLRTIRPGVAPSEFVVAGRATTHAAGISPE
jgi:hypothetical protein